MTSPSVRVPLSVSSRRTIALIASWMFITHLLLSSVSVNSSALAVIAAASGVPRLRSSMRSAAALSAAASAARATSGRSAGRSSGSDSIPRVTGIGECYWHRPVLAVDETTHGLLDGLDDGLRGWAGHRSAPIRLCHSSWMSLFVVAT